MAKIKNSFVGGGWGAAAAVVETRNPVNPDDLVGVLCVRAGDLGDGVPVRIEGGGGLSCYVRGAWRMATGL
jgi:hypothetical protein